MSVQTKASRVRLLLFDVDGVLTTGEVIMHADGSESKGFHIRDGAAIVWAQRAGLTVGLLSARSSGATAHRAAQLAVRIVEQGVKSKIAAYEQIIRDAKVDDRGCGLHGRRSPRPAGAGAGRVVGRAGRRGTRSAGAGGLGQHVAGGRGAVRELVELVLRAQQRWDDVLRQHLPQA